MRHSDVTFLTGLRAVGRWRAKELKVSAVEGTEREKALDRLAVVRVDTAWLPMALGDRWVAAYRLAVQGGATVVAEIRIFPREKNDYAEQGEWSAEIQGFRARVPTGGITSRLVRLVKVGEHLRVADAVLQEWGENDPPAFVEDTLERFGLAAEQRGHRTPRIGRPRKPALWYARLAEAYVRALRQGVRGPVKEVARQRGVRPAQVRDWIHRAREFHLLSEGRQGQSGGQLTAAALRLLKRRKTGRRKRS